jgi:putative transposase
VKTPFQAPDAKAFFKSWIYSVKRETLNHFYCFSRAHLDFIAGQLVDHYNNFRPHQSKGNEPLRLPGERTPRRASPQSQVECRRMLGGLLKHYYRKAA